MIKRLIIMLFTTVFLSGCAAQWQGVTTSNKVIKQNGLTLELPEGWVTIKINENLQITSLDGPGLNQISVETIKLKDIEKKLKIELSKDIDTLDASKQFLAYWSSQTGISEFDITSNNYVEQNDHSYFKIQWQFKDTSGVLVRNISQGFVANGLLTHVAFSAPHTHYFDKSESAYNEILNALSHSE